MHESIELRVFQPADQAAVPALLETTATWMDTIEFSRRCGFAVTHHVEGEFGEDVWFERLVSPTSGASGP